MPILLACQAFPPPAPFVKFSCQAFPTPAPFVKFWDALKNYKPELEICERFNVRKMFKEMLHASAEEAFLEFWHKGKELPEREEWSDALKEPSL